MNDWKKCRKKPVVVEYREPKPPFPETIHTREGVLCAYPKRDYIIKGVEGEIYPCNKEIFNKTYVKIREKKK